MVGLTAALALTVWVAARCPNPNAAAAVLVIGGLLAAPHLLATDLVLACFSLVLAGMAAVGPLLVVSLASLALAVRIPTGAAAWGGCLLLGALLASVAGLPGRSWTPGIIGHEFGSR